MMYWIAIFYFPVVFFAVFHFGSIPRPPAWTSGYCTVLFAGEGKICDGYSISWDVSFCLESECQTGPSINTTIYLCVSDILAMNISLSKHPVFSTSKCYYNAPASAAFWANGIDWTVSWSRVGFYCSIGWIVVSLIPIVNRTIVACRLAHFYQTSPPQPTRAAAPVAFPAQRDPLGPVAQEYSSEGDSEDDGGESSVTVDVERLNIEASCELDAPNVCMICFSHRINSRLMPCGHEFACFRCAKYFLRTSKSCGLCRAPVERVDRIDPKSENAHQMDLSDSYDEVPRDQMNSEAHSEASPPNSV